MNNPQIYYNYILCTKMNGKHCLQMNWTFPELKQSGTLGFLDIPLFFCEQVVLQLVLLLQNEQHLKINSYYEQGCQIVQIFK